MAKKALILGGTGLIGRALVPEMLADEWDLTVLSRHPPGQDIEWRRDVDHVPFDRESESLHGAIRRDYDVLIDMVAYEPSAARQLIDAGDRVGSLIVISTVSVYADERGRSMEAQEPTEFPDLPNPIPESQTTVGAGTSSYPTKKVALEEHLLSESQVPVTIVRPGMIYGPGDRSSREWFFVKRILDGRHKLVLAYEGATQLSVVSSRNLAELIVLSAQNPVTRILNAADKESQSARSIAHAVGDIFGHEWDEVLLEGDPVESVGDTPWTAPRSFVVDIRRAREELSYESRADYKDALRETCEWLVSTTSDSDWKEVLPKTHRMYGSLFDYENEDRYLATTQD